MINIISNLWRIAWSGVAITIFILFIISIFIGYGKIVGRKVIKSVFKGGKIE
jgi:hypothetical protein